MSLPPIHLHATADEARETLAAAGWTEIGAGDWSWVLADPAGAVVARITPYDPAWQLHAAACVRHQRHPHLPLIHEIAPLRGEGYVATMERLFPCAEGEAAAFCAALALSRKAPPADPGLTLRFSAQPYVQNLRGILVELLEEAAVLPFFGGADVRPGNLMCDRSGVIKVIDPIYVAGKAIAAAIEHGDRLALAAIGRANLEAFLTIPAFRREGGAEALRVRLDALYDGRANEGGSDEV